MKHLLDIEQLTQEMVRELINKALSIKNNQEPIPQKAGELVTLFYENSTRTRMSFSLAATRMGMTVMNLDNRFSSEQKGESIDDTLLTLAAMGFEYFVIRHSTEGMPAALAAKYGTNIHILNAGDGKRGHPSQALIDFMTISEFKPDFTKIKIAIVGDILHSRVANSLMQLSELMNVGELVFVAPKPCWPEANSFGRVTSSLKEGIGDADVIILLRIQHERMQKPNHFDIEDYYNQYMLTNKNLAYAKKDVIVMHPGPINRGIEIANDVADGAHSKILKQVENSVFMRIAILSSLKQSA